MGVPMLGETSHRRNREPGSGLTRGEPPNALENILEVGPLRALSGVSGVLDLQVPDCGEVGRNHGGG